MNTQKVMLGDKAMIHIKDYLAAMIPTATFKYDQYFQRITIEPGFPLYSFSLDGNFTFILQVKVVKEDDLAFMVKVLAIAKEAEKKFRNI